MSHYLTASIVTYKNSPEILRKAIQSFLDTDLEVRLYMVDNSPDDDLNTLCDDERIVYIFNNENLGFAKGHNIAIRQIQNESIFHLILNPDVYFEKGVLEELTAYLDKNREVGLISPKILYPDGTLQYSCRMIPTPFDMLIRRLGLLSSLFSKRIAFQEFRFTGYTQLMEVPFFHGCFLMLRNDVFQKTGLLDERYFMYMEDLDFCRRVAKNQKVVFYPDVQIYHHYARASQKKLKALQRHLTSMIQYFNKWGWFNDKERRKINTEIIQKLPSSN